VGETSVVVKMLTMIPTWTHFNIKEHRFDQLHCSLSEWTNQNASFEKAKVSIGPFYFVAKNSSEVHVEFLLATIQH